MANATRSGRARGGLATFAAYALVAGAAGAADVAAERVFGVAWAGYAASAIVIVLAILVIERGRARRAAAADPDLRLYHAVGTRADVVDRLLALERSGRAKAGVGVALPPGECKLWIRHEEGAYDVHAFAVAEADAVRFAGIVAILERSTGVKRVRVEGRPHTIATFRATLTPEALGAIIEEARITGSDGTAPVSIWWSTTLGELAAPRV